MKKILFTLFFLTAAISLSAKGPDVRIAVTLDSAGNARITEIWNAEVTKGTEFYLVRSNLRDMEVGDLAVSDESGTSYAIENPWISKGRSLEEKSGKCGILETDKGVEICWGLGSYGRHQYTVSYSMTNMVQRAQDADLLHIQFVSPGMSDSPEHAAVTVRFSGECCEAKGYGFRGTCTYDKGEIKAETTEAMDGSNSVIILAKFPKGTFSTSSVREENYADVLEEAEDDGGTAALIAIAIGLGILALTVIFAVWYSRETMRSVTGVSKMSDIEPSRNIPFGGDVLKSYYVLLKVGENSEPASGLMMKFILEGYTTVSTDRDGKSEISFKQDADTSKLTETERQLLDYMMKAAGDDSILQKKEMEKWSLMHSSKISKWFNSAEKEAKNLLKEDGTLDAKGKFTDIGKERALGVLAYRKHLKNWIGDNIPDKVNEELVFSALFGYSKKLMKICKTETSYLPIYYMLYFNHCMNSSVTAYGMNSGTSVSGGHGFSGGGAGGGCR